MLCVGAPMINKVLVTGGSGFIGQHLVDALLQQGFVVLNIDIVPPENTLRESIWRCVDIVDKESLARTIEEFEPDTVVHLAARAEIQSTNLSAFESIHTGTRNLLTACNEVPSIERFINISTQLVVGPGYYPQGDSFYKPYTVYGEAKVLAEQHLKSIEANFVWTNLRPTNIWGPGHPSFAHSIWKYLEKGYYLQPDTANPVLRCYGYVKNTVAQIVAFAKAPSEEIDRKTFYLADHVLDSTLWVDSFSYALRGKRCRRAPSSLLKTLGVIGDIALKLKIPSPIESGRVFRMLTNYPAPLEATFKICGNPTVSLQKGVEETCVWLKRQ